MFHGIGKYYGGKAAGYACVHLQWENAETDFRIRIALDDHVWNDQLRNDDFADWTDAALSGVRYALQHDPNKHGHFLVVHVIGLVCDTIPRYVAYAAVVATWDAIGFIPCDVDNTSLSNWTASTFEDWKHT